SIHDASVSPIDVVSTLAYDAARCCYAFAVARLGRSGAYETFALLLWLRCAALRSQHLPGPAAAIADATGKSRREASGKTKRRKKASYPDRKSTRLNSSH